MKKNITKFMYEVVCTFHLDVYIKRTTTNSLFKYFDFIKRHVHRASISSVSPIIAIGYVSVALDAQSSCT